MATLTGTSGNDTLNGTNNFSNTNSISIVDNAVSNPYPSSINVSGINGTISNNIKVTLNNLSHTFPDDIDILLVGPTGAAAILMSDVGGSLGINNLTFTFDPSAAQSLSDSGQLTSGTFKPTDFQSGDLFPNPAPIGAFGTDFSVFNNTNPNGAWKLFILDDAGNDVGTLAGGWSLTFDYNTLIGGSGDDILTGTNGNDFLTGGLGNDTINGGTGFDTVVESGDVDFNLTNSALTGNGTDTLINIESASLTGGIGNNFLNALFFTLGNVTLDGGAGNDGVYGGAGDDTILGGIGNDALTGGLGNDTLDGGTGSDIVFESGDVNFILTNSTLTGLGTDTLISIETVVLTGGIGNNTLNASAFTLGSVSLSGGAGDDTILGGSGNDYLAGGLGNDTLNGGTGNDTVFESGDVNFTLTNSTLTGLGTDTLISIEFANLTGGIGNNTLNASAFTLGGVTLNGGAGDDTILGGSGNDFLAGGLGNDILNGGTGNDTVFESGNVNFTLTNSTLTGLGTDTLISIEAANITGGIGNNSLNAVAFTLGSVNLDGGDGDDSIAGGSQSDILSGGNGNDTIRGGLGNDNIDGGAGTDTIKESGDVNFTLTNFSLTGNGIDTLTSIESANITGGIGDNNLSAFSFTLGSVTFNGGAGSDNLVGGTQNDTLLGGDDNDFFRGNLGNDIINGENGTDTLIESGDVNFTLTNSSLVGNGTDTLISIETALLTGGIGDNILNASAFTLGSVTLDGGDGNDTLTGGSQIDDLKGGLGDDNLSGGAGGDTLIGGDGNDTLNGGTGSDVVFESGDVNFLLTNSTLTGKGSDTLIGIETVILSGGIGNNSLNAVAFTLGSVYLSGGAGNDSIAGGSGSDYLSGEDGDDTIRGGLGTDTINGGVGIDTVKESGDVNFILTNSSLDGNGTDTLIGIESANLTGGIGNNSLNAVAFTLGSVTLNGGLGDDSIAGGSGNDNLIGGSGNDTIRGGLGNDSIDGGLGTDTVKESGDVNFTLTNSTLTGNGSDTLIGIESANLTGGIGNNILNASAFTLGSVILNGGVGIDTLTGGSKNDTLVGGDGNDFLTGTGSTNGFGSIDTLTGEAGNDTFILSNPSSIFYNDGNNANAGLGDYALITDFNSAQDKIQLEGAANLYVLGSSPIAGITGTSIFLDTNSNGVFNATDELIAIAQGAAGLNLASSSFVYV